MLRRTVVLLALTTATLPLGALGQDREWEEDYSDQFRDDGPPPGGDYDVSVDLNDQGSVSIDSFQGALSPYGDWVDVGSYGRCWRPRVAAGWRPYYYGRWEWTNEGWLWVSDEPFGWAAYHYGRWTYDAGFGWLWVPGYQWAPAWVAWRYSGDIVGWAPLGPGLSVYVSTYPFVDYWWTFVPTGRFVGAPVYSVAYPPRYARQYFNSTNPAPPRPIPSRAVPGGRPSPSPAWGGPAPRVIEQRIGRPVTPVRVVPAPSPGAARVGPGEVSIYRPERPAPGRAGVRGPGPAPAPGRADGAVQVPGRGGQGGLPPGREAPGRVAPGREAPGRATPGRGRGNENRDQGWSPPGRDSGRGPAPAPGRGREGAWGPPADGRAPGMPPARGGREDFARGGARTAPARTEPGVGGGYSPPSRGFGGAAAPRAERGGGAAAPAPAPRAERESGGGGRAAPGRGDRER